jgi:hypothetical protein
MRWEAMSRAKIVFRLSLVLAALFILTMVGISCTPEPAPPPEPPAFQVAELTISPTKVNPGEEVTIAAKVTNFGGTDGSYAAELKINGVTEANASTMVAAGVSQSLSFAVFKYIPGIYQVTWSELGGEFMVVKPVALPEPASPQPATPPPTRTLTLTDAEATNLLRQCVPGTSVHFMAGNKVQMGCAFVQITPTVGIFEGRIWLDGVPSWIVDYYGFVIGSYTSYFEGKLTLTALPPWFDPTVLIAPDVTGLPTFLSITTEDGMCTITYLCP